MAACLLASVIPSVWGQNGAAQQRPRRVQTPANPPANGGKPADPSQEVDDGDVVRVDTQLVSVPAVVVDKTGRPVINLKPEDFVLYEDGKPQSIANFATTDAPFEVALLLDTSGSTREDVQLIREAAHSFITALKPNDRVAVLAFDNQVHGGTNLATVQVATRLTSDRPALRRAVESIGASNGTPFYDGLSRIVDSIFDQPPSEEVRGRRAVVALTDGVDSASSGEYADVKVKMRESGVACYFIEVNTEDYVEDRLMTDCQYGGLRLSRAQLQRYQRIFFPSGSAADVENFCQMGPFERMSISRKLYQLARQEMGELAKNSGGKTFDAATLNDAQAAFAQVAKEIGTQYSLGYYSTNQARDGGYRNIKVELRGSAKGLQVRAREGYNAPREN
jgi:Ca-activated chloride channel family protein